MIYVDMDLPAGALLPDSAPAQHVADSYADFGGISLNAADLLDDCGDLSHWPDTQGDHSARPAAPNTGNARIGSAHGVSVLCLKQGQNCGFALEDILLSNAMCSMAVLFVSTADPAGTLLTLNPRAGRDYLFLAAAEGQLTLKFRDGDDPLVFSVHSTAPATPSAAFTLACATVKGSDMTLAVNDHKPMQLTGTSALQAGAHDLFIGCRSDRAGITKTLGAAQIARVWLWPDRNIFDETTHAALTEAWRGNASALLPQAGT